MSADIIRFPEPIVLLSRKREALSAKVEACLDRGEGALDDQASVQAVKVEDQIAALVPISVAGAIAQFRLLCDLARDFEWDEWADEIANNLIAGLERIGEGRS
jgi:hypothetical protein